MAGSEEFEDVSLSDAPRLSSADDDTAQTPKNESESSVEAVVVAEGSTVDPQPGQQLPTPAAEHTGLEEVPAAQEETVTASKAEKLEATSGYSNVPAVTAELGDDVASEPASRGAVEPASDPTTSDNLSEPPTPDLSGRRASSNGAPSHSSRKHKHRRSRNSIALARGSVDGTETKPAKLFVQNALEKIKASKDARRIPALMTSTTKALDDFLVSPDALPPASEVLEPLRLVCAQAASSDLKCVALDCIGRLFSLSYLYDYEDDNGEATGDENSVLGLAIDTVYDTYDGELTNAAVELQVVKALTAAVVNEDLIVHGPVLLKAIRQVYQVFVVSKHVANQTAAQVSLTQMVQAVFDRVKTRGLTVAASTTSVGSNMGVEVSESSLSNETEPLTLEQMRTSAVDDDEEDEAERQSEVERMVQDAFLLFRTLCKLSDKPGIDDNVHDPGLRSKLLSLHLLHTTLKTQISVFSAPSLTTKLRGRDVRFAFAIKDYIWQTLSNNALSSISAVFEVCAEIFWLVFSNLRSEFKREIEIFLREIYFTVMDLRTATMHQKMYFMGLIGRICTDPRALVELYLNYDCDPAFTNVYENLIALVARMDSGAAAAPPNYVRPSQIPRVYNLNVPTSVALHNLERLQAKPRKPTVEEVARDLHTLHLIALDALVDMLRSLVLWSQRGADVAVVDVEQATSEVGVEEDSAKDDLGVEDDTDDPLQFESRKTQKKALDMAVAEFNFKPARGIDRFLELGLIKEKSPAEVGRVLLNSDGIDKTKLGEYLGGADEFSREVMHSFVESMNFRDMPFVEALRRCLQEFRLPGEGQVVDRYMLEFATKFHDDNPTVFTNADTPYALAYSVMMLNTELHSQSIRRRARMNFDEFLRNMRGVNDGLSLPDEYLREIYDEIALNEIKLESEQQEHIIKEEGYGAASAVISSKTAEIFRSLTPLTDSAYYNASHAEHVRPMFEVAWMSVLAGLSGPLQRYSRSDEAYDTIKLCLDGLGLALRIACHFDVDLARTSFVQTLSKSANLEHLDALRVANIDAVRAILSVTHAEGETLRQAWYDVLLVVSDLERLQLIARGVPVDRLGSVGVLPPDVAASVMDRELVVASDQIFAQSANLTPSALVDFISALARLSQEEIRLSRSAPAPRLFALQKMVDVCYYNMARIRMEWSQMWQAMSEHFRVVLTDENTRIVEFALDSLRQLSMRFLDIEELPHFRFQQDFLAPFEYALKHNDNVMTKVLVLECLKQMVVTKASNLKSGWTTIFAAVEAAPSLETSYELVALVPTNNRTPPPGFLEAVCAVAEQEDARTALKAVLLMTTLFETHPDDLALWHDLFAHMSGVVMRGKDLEVRGKCLTNLFAILGQHGAKFSRDDWDKVFNESLFPLFSVLHSGDSVPLLGPKEEREELSLWLSTTLIQALKSLVQLFGDYFDMLEHALEPFFLDLLRTCIHQEADAVSRMGKTCLQMLVIDNADRLNEKHWHQVATTIVLLFQDTTPSELADRTLIPEAVPNRVARFRGAVAKVVQMLLVMDLVSELLVLSPVVLDRMPVADIMRITSRLKASYHFARDFNRNHELRAELHASGLVRQTPNLLMQESTAAQKYVSVTMRLFRQRDRFKLDPSARSELAEELVPLCQQVLHDYNSMSPADQRYVKTLSDIIVSILHHICRFDDQDFAQNIGPLYLEVIDILNKDMSSELRVAVQGVLRRVADVHILPIASRGGSQDL